MALQRVVFSQGYSPGVDNMTIGVSGGEGILVPEAVRGMGGAKTINALNKKYAGHRGGGSKHGSGRTRFADGGMPADIGQGIGPSQGEMEKWFGKVGDSKEETSVDFAGASIQVNKRVASIIQKIGAQIKRDDPNYIKSGQTGAFRTSVGASTSNIPYSMHQLGLAVDVNYTDNPYLGNNGSILQHPKVIKAFEDNGWFWGGNWGAGGRDQMHFQLEKTNGVGVGGGPSDPAKTDPAKTDPAKTGGGGGGGGGGGSSIHESDNVAAGLAGRGGGGGGGGGGGSAASTKKDPAAPASTTGGASGSGTMTPQEIGALWTKDGGSSSIAPVMAAIAKRESGGQPGIKQQGQPPGLTGWGLWQITPTSGIWNEGQGHDSEAKFGNLLNPDNNAKAAVYLLKESGGQLPGPWASSGGLPAPAYATGGTVPGGTNFQAALGASGSGGCTHNVNLEFKPGSIVIGGGTSGNGSGDFRSGSGTSKFDPSHSARELIREVKKQLESEDLYASISRGDH